MASTSLLGFADYELVSLVSYKTLLTGFDDFCLIKFRTLFIAFSLPSYCKANCMMKGCCKLLKSERIAIP